MKINFITLDVKRLAAAFISLALSAIVSPLTAAADQAQTSATATPAATTAPTPKSKPVKKESAPQIITDPVGTITVYLSRTDQNVIEMPNPIVSKHYSQEKDIQVDTIGHRAIVKFLPSVKQRYEVINNQQTPVGEPEISYAKVKPADLVLILSDNSIYTFKVIPSDTALKTVIIRSTASNLKEALAYETSSPYQETLGKLAKSVLQGQTPSGYRVTENGSKWRIKEADITVTLVKSYKGALYNVHLLNVYNWDKTEKRYDGQLLFSIAEQIFKNSPRAVSWYYGNYAHIAPPESYVKALIITEGGGKQ
jgi:hypothetical protein